MINARVSLDKQGWSRDMARRIERRIPGILEDATQDGAKAASAASQSRRRSGLMAQMEILPVMKTPRGFSSGFRSKAWYAKFQSKGTKRGITPLRFLEAGRTVARRSIVDRMNRL